MTLLTENAPYDEPGSWGRLSQGWPEIVGPHAYDLWVFASRTGVIPYGSYVLMTIEGRYGATCSMLRVHGNFKHDLLGEFEAAGKPGANTWP